VDPAAICHVNMELLDNDRYRDLHVLQKEVRRVRSACGGRVYLFLDEVQEIPQWERLVNSVLAEDLADITLTGSNSRLLAGELGTLLSGRYVEFAVHPLVFGEYCDLWNVPTGRDAFMAYLESGGMPGLLTVANDPASRLQYLEAILDSIVLRDVVARHKLRDTELLRRILLFVADNIGNPVSARSIAGVLKSQRRPSSVESIYNYLHHLEEAFVIHPAPYYDVRGKRLLETGGKWYFADVGLRHALVGYRSGDVGQFLENIVFIELKHRGWTVTVGRIGEFEVDFVASRADEKIYIQVAYLTPDNKTLERELRPLQAIDDNFPKYLLTLDALERGQHNGIIRMPVEEFLIECPPAGN
jgi:predicted AAA+ superfamily ATPase